MNPGYPARETRSGYGTTVASALKTVPKPALAGAALAVLGIVIALIAGATAARSPVPVATLLIMLGGVSVASSAFVGHGAVGEAARRRRRSPRTRSGSRPALGDGRGAGSG